MSECFGEVQPGVDVDLHVNSPLGTSSFTNWRIEIYPVILEIESPDQFAQRHHEFSLQLSETSDSGRFRLSHTYNATEEPIVAPLSLDVLDEDVPYFASPYHLVGEGTIPDGAKTLELTLDFVSNRGSSQIVRVASAIVDFASEHIEVIV